MESSAANTEIYNKIKSFQGFLLKKSPNFISRYQKRFYRIEDEGRKLCYYKTIPKINQAPLGVIFIKYIDSIDKKDSTHFEISFEGRIYELKTEKDERSDSWVDVLMFLKKYLVENFPGEDTGYEEYSSGGKIRNSFSKILDFNKKKYDRKYSEQNSNPGAKSFSKRITFSPTKSLNPGELASYFSNKNEKIEQDFKKTLKKAFTSVDDGKIKNEDKEEDEDYEEETPKINEEISKNFPMKTEKEVHEDEKLSFEPFPQSKEKDQSREENEATINALATKLSAIEDNKDNYLESFNDAGFIKKIISIETPPENLYEPLKEEFVEIFNMKQEEKNIIEVNEEENEINPNDHMNENQLESNDNVKNDSSEKKKIESLPEIIDENAEEPMKNDLEVNEKNMVNENNKIDSNVVSEENFLNDLDFETKTKIENFEISEKANENLSFAENNQLESEIESDNQKEIEELQKQQPDAEKVNTIFEQIIDKVPDLDVKDKTKKNEEEENNDKINEQMKNNAESEKERPSGEEIKTSEQFQLKEHHQNIQNDKKNSELEKEQLPKEEVNYHTTQLNDNKVHLDDRNTHKKIEILVDKNKQTIIPSEVANEVSKTNRIEKTNENKNKDNEETLNPNEDLFEEKNIYEKSLLETEKANELIDKTQSNIIFSSQNQDSLPKRSGHGLSDHYAVEPTKTYKKNQKMVVRKTGFFSCC